MGNPVFKEVTLERGSAGHEWYGGRVRGCYVRVWFDQRPGGTLKWLANCDVGAGKISTEPRATASLALRSLLTELNRVHRKLGKLLEPVKRKKTAK